MQYYKCPGCGTELLEVPGKLKQLTCISCFEKTRVHDSLPMFNKPDFVFLMSRKIWNAIEGDVTETYGVQRESIKCGLDIQELAFLKEEYGEAFPGISKFLKEAYKVKKGLTRHKTRRLCLKCHKSHLNYFPCPDGNLNSSTTICSSCCSDDCQQCTLDSLFYMRVRNKSMEYKQQMRKMSLLRKHPYGRRLPARTVEWEGSHYE